MVGAAGMDHPPGVTIEPSQRIPFRYMTSYARHPPPPAIKSLFSTSCMVCCIPSNAILGDVGYVQPGKQRPESEAGRELGDYPASPPCLTNRKTEAQAGQESDLRFHRDSLSLLPLRQHHDGRLPSPAHLIT